MTGRLPCGFLILASGLGCLDLVDPKVGAPLTARCANQDSNPDTDVSFSRDLQLLFRGEAGAVGCGCHIPTNQDPIGFQESGLDLSTYSSALAGGVNSLGSIIVAGMPCESVLWQKASPSPPFGSRMPFDGPPFLPEASLQLIADWIAEGARDN